MNETNPELPLRGGCMCGAVRYEIDEPLLGALYCHCKRCQRRSGGPFSTTALTAPGSLRVVGGEERLKDYRPDGGYVKTFCSECGSHVYTTNPDDSNLRAVRMGTIDGDPGVAFGAHQYCNYSAPWEPVFEDGLPRFAERIGAELIPRTGEAAAGS